MIITIGGKAGGGKSTTAKSLAEKLNYKQYSMGDLQREIAKDLGMTIEELAEFEKTDDKYDHMIDDKQIKLGKEEDDFTMDGWLSAHFIPNSIKVFLDVNIDEAVKRRVKHHRDTESFSNVDEAKKSMLNRQKNNRERWLKFYNYDFLDMKNYDLIIDTTELTPDEVLEEILNFVETKK